MLWSPVMVLPVRGLVGFIVAVRIFRWQLEGTMGRWGWVALLIVMGVAAAAMAGAPASWAHVSVLRDDGGRLDDVTLAWALDGFLLEAKAADGKVTVLSPDQVHQVLGGDNRDLTDEVADACPAEGIDFRLLGSRKHVPLRFALMADAGWGVALSNGNGGSTAHGTLLAGLRLGLSDRVHLRLGYRRLRVTESPTLAGSEMAADTGALLALLGFRLKHPRENNNYAYLEGGFSVVHYAQRYGSGLVGPGFTTISPALQGGVVLPLNARFGVDLGGFLGSRASLDAAASQTVLMVGAYVALTWRGSGA